ncbi:MAG: hypothetical protein RL153_2152 [Verrucomicrobiota bacterium]
MPTIPPSADRPASAGSLPGENTLDGNETAGRRVGTPQRTGSAGKSVVQTTLWWAWAEWMAHGRMLLGFLVGWLAVVWFLPLIAHPLWVLAHGLVYAMAAGPALGGADVLGGCEEFAFAGPLTRGQRYMGRLLLGCASVVAFSAMSIVALAGNLSDVLLRVFVSSLPAALELEHSLTLNGLVWAVPVSVFGFGFVVAALARTRVQALQAWLWGVLAALAVLRGTFWLEELRFGRLNGWLAVPGLFVTTAGVLWLGLALYRRKEAGTAVGPLRMPPGWWTSLLTAGLALAAVGVLGAWFARNFTRLTE